MAISIGDLIATIRLRDDLSAQLAKATGQLEKAGAKMQRLGGQMRSAGAAMTTGITLPLAALGAGATKAFGDFDQAMKRSLAIMGDVSPALQAEMAATARTVAGELEPSATQAAESFFFLASAGLDAKQSIAALPTVARFAQAGAFDMALATDLLTDAQSALGLTIRDDVVKNMENMARVSDVLVKANTLANASVEQFSTALTRDAGAAMRNFGIELEEGVAVLAAYADQGIKAELAGTSFARMLRLLVPAANDNAAAYKQMGVEVFDLEGNLRPLASIIRDLTELLEPMGVSQRSATLEMLGFQKRVQQVVLPLIGLSDGIEDYRQNLLAAGGVTQEVADKQLESFKLQMKLVRDQLVDAAITLGQSIGPALLDFSQNVLVPAIEALARMAERFGALPAPVRNASIAIAALLAAAGPVAFVLGNIVTAAGFASTAIAGLGNAAAAASLKLTALKASLGLVGLAVAALGFAWTEHEKTAARTEERMAELRAEFDAGKVSIEDLREQLDKLDLTIVRDRGEIATIRALRKLLEELGEEVQGLVGSEGLKELEDGFTQVQAKADDLVVSAEDAELAFLELHGTMDSITVTAPRYLTPLEAITKKIEEQEERVKAARQALADHQRQIRESAIAIADAERLIEESLGLAGGGPIVVDLANPEDTGTADAWGLAIAEAMGDSIPRTGFGEVFAHEFSQGVAGIGGELGDAAVDAIINSDLDKFFSNLGEILASKLAGVGFDSLVSGLGSAFGLGSAAALGVGAFFAVFAAGAIGVLTGAFDDPAVVTGFLGITDNFGRATEVFKNSVFSFEDAAVALAEVARSINSELGDLFGPIGGFRIDSNAVAPLIPGNVVGDEPGRGNPPGPGFEFTNPTEQAGGGGGPGGGSSDPFGFSGMLKRRLANGILGGLVSTFDIVVQEIGGEFRVAIPGLVTGFGDSLENATQDMLDRFARRLPELIESGRVVLEHVPAALVEVLKNSGAQSFDELEEALRNATDVFLQSLGPLEADLFTGLNTMIANVQQAIVDGLPLDVAAAAVKNQLNAMTSAIAGAELFPQLASKKSILDQFREALERLGISGKEAAMALGRARLAVRFFNMELKANVLGQLASLAQEFGVQAEIIKKAKVLEVKLQFLLLKAQLKALGLWEANAALWRQLFTLAKQQARRVGEGFSDGSHGLRDFGAGVVTTLHGREEVLTAGQGDGVVAKVDRIAKRGSMGGEFAKQLLDRIDQLAVALIRQQSAGQLAFIEARAKGLV